ncbi:hypothetical protein AVEN_7678-1, partial [Araneus ventricosus]
PPLNGSQGSSLPSETVVTQGLADVGLGLIGEIIQVICLIILVIIGYYIIYRIYLILKEHCHSAAVEEFEPASYD